MKMPVFKTDQYDEFRCVGGECPYTCCAGYWRIDVDEETDRRYQAMTGEFADRLNASINRSGTPAVMDLTPDGRCAMLTADGWCAVQRELGAEALCDTCRNYPRNAKVRGGVVFQTMTPSCPEVARALLARKKPLTLREGTADISKAAGAEPGGAETRARLLTGVRLLQDRDCTLAQRQLLFLLFNQSLRSAADKPDEAAELLDYFNKPSNRRALAAEQPEQGCDLASKVRFLNRLCAPLLKEIPVIQTTELFKAVLRFVLSGEDAMERTLPYFELMNEGEFARGLETMLVQNCLRHYADPDCGADCFEQAGYIVALAQLCRLFCAVGSAEKGDLLSLDERVRHWSFISRGFEHNGDLRGRVSGILRDEGLLELPFLFRLIS